MKNLAGKLFDLIQKSDKWFDRKFSKYNPYDPKKLEVNGLKPLVIEESNIRKRTLQILALFSGLFLFWSITAPLDAGVTLQGKVMVSGKRKAVAHPNGGVVLSILVKEGAAVEKGDILLTINPLGTEANLNDAELEYINALANESRLLAERIEALEVTWSPELLQKALTDQRAEQTIAVQQKIFSSGLAERTQQDRIYSERLSNLRDQLKEQKIVFALKKEQLTTLSEEATNSRELAREGFVPLSTANEIERQRSNLLSSISSSTTSIADIQSQISAIQLELVQRKAVFQKEVNQQLTEAQKTRKSMSARIESLVFDRSLAEVRAPESGEIVGLQANTVGGVIAGGQTIMEIVPRESKLVVEAMVPPVQVDKVRKGLEADVRFTAFNLRTTPLVTGNVTLIGGDLQPMIGNQPEHYLALVETTADGIKKLDGLDVQPGMPVNVIVKNGERTFMSYLLKPLIDSFALAFKD